MKNRNIKKFMSCLMSAAMTAALLTGCGSNTGTPADSAETPAAGSETEEAASKPENTSTEGGQTITIAAGAGWIKDIDKELAAKYEEQSGNKIEWQISPDDQYENVLNSKLAVGEGADIFYIRSGVTINRYQPDKYMMDLSDQEWVSRYTDWAKEGTSYNDKVLQFQTWSVDGWGILYNKPMFEEAGITEVPHDYASFKDACDKILAIGKTPIYQPGATQWHLGVWLGGLTTQVDTLHEGFYDGLNDNTQVLAGREELITALNQMVELEEAGYFGNDFMAKQWENSVAEMASGEYAMCVTYTTYPAEIEAVNPDMPAESWGMFPIPLNDNQIFGVSAGGVGRCVNKDTKVADAVFDYFNFLSQPENLTAFYNERLDLGPCSFTDIPGNVPAAYSDIMTHAAGTGFAAEDGVMFWDNTQVGNLIQAMYLGGSSAEDVLEGIDEFRQPSFGE